MNILILNMYDITGGAARAVYRLHKGILNTGIQSQMLVNSKVSDDNTVICNKTKIEKIFGRIAAFVDYSVIMRLYSKQNNIRFSINFLPREINLINKINKINPDIVHLNWIGESFFRIESLRHIKSPIIWRLCDMWAFTGGCHYDDGCGRYKISCGKCPATDSNKEQDLSRWVWKRKRKSWKDIKMVIVTPSKWLSECAKESSLFKDVRIEVIPNGVDTRLFKPIDKNIARELLSLPKDKKIILFGAINALSDKRKGYHLLIAALNKLSEDSISKEIALVVFGASMLPNPPDLPFPVHFIGHLSDNLSLAIAYSSADVFVAPSIQENFANTVLESLSCGTPVVAFNIGGMPDMIEHGENGYLAKPFDVDSLADGIKWVVEDEKRHDVLKENARVKVLQEFTLEMEVQRYLQLYKELLRCR